MALAVQGYVMKLGFISTLGIALTFTLSGCSSEPTTTFTQLDDEMSDFCSKFNTVDESGKQITVNSYTIKVVDIDSNGNKIETNKIVDCGA